MEKHESFWKAHTIEIALLVLVIFLTGLLIHMNSRLSRVSRLLEVKIDRVDGNMGDLKAQLEERFNLLDERLVKNLSRRDRNALPLEGRVPGQRDAAAQRHAAYPRPDQSLDFRTIADPEIENLALNWGILKRAFPRRLRDSKRAYLDLINQLGFPVTEQQRMQMRKVVHETFGLVECITTSAGWEE